MAAKAKSQWDFGGELFPVAETRQVFSVTEITGTVRRLLEKQIGSVWITGEVSNLRAQSSGHLYFSLKDAGAQISCVCFRDDARGSRQLIADGRKVVLQGDVTVYEARGQYQLIVRSVELEGVGALQLAFEKLKKQLAAEGLFAPERKRAIPPLVHRLGLVTSPTGAALRDVLHVIERRHPGLEIILAPCRVQGQGAAEEIAAAIRMLNEWSGAERGARNVERGTKFGTKLDAILITRGGGSLEDLWAFNEEVVARAVFDSAVPVVSAVGHEIDFTISDFVADLRAATPSAAAELLTEGMMRRREWVAEIATHLFTLARERVESEREEWEQLAARLLRVHPRRMLNERWQRLDDLQTSLLRGARQELRRQQVAVANVTQRLVRLKPSRRIAPHRQTLHDLTRRLRENARQQLANYRQRLQVADTRLRLLAPEQVLARGFSITRDAETGEVLRDAKRMRAGRTVRTTLSNGEFTSQVQD